MDNLEFSNCEISHLHNALTTAFFYSQKQLSHWLEVAEKNPSAMACVKMTELEISSYSDLLKKLESARGF